MQVVYDKLSTDVLRRRSKLYRFARWNHFQQSKSLRELLSSDFAYPNYLWEDMHHESNGYAGSASYKRSTGEEVHSTYQNQPWLTHHWD